jgi:membrane complex biogenesis BtpA family protein
MWNRQDFQARLQTPLIGMVHLPALPGSPRWQQDWSAVRHSALSNTRALVAGGITAIMVENYHDVPFYPSRVPQVTVAAMAVVVADIRREYPALLIGVNVLRNDAAAALAIASTGGADFIRVNVHSGAAVTDQGLVSGEAHQTLRLRREIAPTIAIMADLRVKHARPLVERPVAEEGVDLRRRGLADAIIVTGAATGAPADLDQLTSLRAALPDCPLLVGSGLNRQNLGDFWPVADGFIVGTSLQAGQSGGDVEPAEVTRLVARLRQLQTSAGGTERKDME